MAGNKNQQISYENSQQQPEATPDMFYKKSDTI